MIPEQSLITFIGPVTLAVCASFSLSVIHSLCCKAVCCRGLRSAIMLGSGMRFRGAAAPVHSIVCVRRLCEEVGLGWDRASCSSREGLGSCVRRDGGAWGGGVSDAHCM